MRVLITGANGQLGNELLKVLDKHEVFGFSKEELNITDAKNVSDKLQEVEPNVVIHCAAYTNVDGCESESDLAYKVNASGAGNIAAECLRLGAAMVYVSTDYVFDGQKGQPYYEFDKPNPINAYGRTKLAGEEIVKSLLKHYYIVRTAWLYGNQGGNFVKTMLKLAEKQDKLNVVNDQIGSPTNALDLAKAIGTIIESNKYGVYHATNSGSCSWFDFAKKIFDIKGINVGVNPITSDQLNRPAKRPEHSILNNFNLQANLGYEMRSWEEALREYLTVDS